jgi:hypothetical protein
MLALAGNGRAPSPTTGLRPSAHFRPNSEGPAHPRRTAPQRVYRDRGVRGLASRRPLNLTDYLVVLPEEMELDDDNDSLESAVEGARMNYDLYDAYTNPTGLCTYFLPSLSLPSNWP